MSSTVLAGRGRRGRRQPALRAQGKNTLSFGMRNPMIAQYRGLEGV
jgi:hypothetical protein